jgi:hypothetical protein
MNTGYNTDVRHQDVVFHVQTEDKGAGNPFIESLVYVGGQVLATKRASYANLLSEGQDEKAIVALMDHQHRTMIAAIKLGKFDEKLGALNASRQTGRHPTVTPPMPGLMARTPGQAPVPPSMTASPAVAAPSAVAAPPAVARQAVAAPPVAPLTPISDRDRLPPLAPPPAARQPERTLDQVILEYLTNEADQEQLLLMLEDDSQLGLGRDALLNLRTSSSKSGLPIAGALVTVKMISTVSEPSNLAYGRTDEGGLLSLSFAIPALHRGTAALIITAVSSIGRAELKHLL